MPNNQIYADAMARWQLQSIYQDMLNDGKATTEINGQLMRNHRTKSRWNVGFISTHNGNNSTDPSLDHLWNKGFTRTCRER